MGTKAPSTPEGVIVAPGEAQSSEGFETGLFYLGFLNSMPIGTCRLGCEELCPKAAWWNVPITVRVTHHTSPLITKSVVALGNQGMLCWMCMGELNERVLNS